MGKYSKITEYILLYCLKNNEFIYSPKSRRGRGCPLREYSGGLFNDGGGVGGEGGARNGGFSFKWGVGGGGGRGAITHTGYAKYPL